MKIEAKLLMEEIAAKVNELVPLINSLQDQLASANKFDLADTAFATREANASLSVLEKRINVLHVAAAARCCIEMAAAEEPIIRTDHCTVSPKPRPWFKVAYKRDKNPSQWDTIMDAVGVSDLANKEDIVRLHIPGLMDYCAKKMAEGVVPPVAGINPKELTGMTLDVHITRKKG